MIPAWLDLALIAALPGADADNRLRLGEHILAALPELELAAVIEDVVRRQVGMYGLGLDTKILRDVAATAAMAVAESLRGGS